MRKPAQQIAALDFFYALGLTMPGIVVLWGATRRRRRNWRSVMTLLAGLLLVLLLLSCAGGTGNQPRRQLRGRAHRPDWFSRVAITSTSATLNWAPSSAGFGLQRELVYRLRKRYLDRRPDHHQFRGHRTVALYTASARDL